MYPGENSNCARHVCCAQLPHDPPRDDAGSAFHRQLFTPNNTGLHFCSFKKSFRS